MQIRAKQNAIDIPTLLALSAGLKLEGVHKTAHPLWDVKASQRGASMIITYLYG